jgi:hypothetical protein
MLATIGRELDERLAYAISKCAFRFCTHSISCRRKSMSFGEARVVVLLRAVSKSYCCGRNGLTLQIITPRVRGSVKFLLVDLYTELDDCNEVSGYDVSRQWHLRGARGDSDSLYRNEERNQMVFTFTSGWNAIIRLFVTMSFKTNLTVNVTH